MRKRTGYAFAVVALVYLLFVVTLPVPKELSLFIVFPIAISALGFIQARQKLCVNYAVRGIENLSADSVGNTTKSSDSVASKAKLKATWIMLQSLLIAAIITLVIYIIL